MERKQPGKNVEPCEKESRDVGSDDLIVQSCWSSNLENLKRVEVAETRQVVKNPTTIFQEGLRLDTKQNMVAQLRKFASVPGKQRTWVSELSDDHLYELFLKLRTGEGATSIGRHAQKAWKVNPRSSAHSMSQGVLKFKQRIAHLLLLTSQSFPQEASGLALPVGSGDALETMEAIARQYEARIQSMIAEEKETGMRYPYINRDLQALASLRKTILKQKEWDSSHDDPLKRREYERRDKIMERRFHALMDELGEEGQARVVRAAERFLELAEQRGIIMCRTEDGTYVPVDTEQEA